MKNNFNVEVSFSYVPLKPYEWVKSTFLSNLKAIRVSSKTLWDILTYDVIVPYKNKTLLLSDIRDSIVIRLDDNGKVVSRSFLKFSKDLDVCEYACNLKVTDLKLQILDKKINYDFVLDEEKEIKSFLIKSIKSNKNEHKSRYLYYLYFKRLDDYSKDKLIESIKVEDNCKYYELYDFLTKN